MEYEFENCKSIKTTLLDLHETAFFEIFKFLNDIDIYCGCRNVCRILRKYADTYLPCVGTFLCVTGVSDSNKNDDFPLFKNPVDIDVDLLYVFKRQRNGQVTHVSSESGPPITVSPKSFMCVDENTSCDPSCEYIKRLVNFKILDIFGSVINGKTVIGMYIDEMFEEEISRKEGMKIKHMKSNVWRRLLPHSQQPSRFGHRLIPIFYEYNVDNSKWLLMTCSNVTPIIYYCDVDVHTVSYSTNSSIMIGLHVYRDSRISPEYDFRVVKFKFSKNKETSMKSYKFGRKMFLNQNECNHDLSEFSEIRYHQDVVSSNSNQEDLDQKLFWIGGTRTLDQMNRHKPVSFYSSKDICREDRNYPCPKNINENVMTLTHRAKAFHETFEHQMFSNLWQNSGELEAIWGKVLIKHLPTKWERNYFKLKDEVFIFEGPRHFISTGMVTTKYDIKTRSEELIRCQNFQISYNDRIQTVVIDDKEEFAVILCTDITECAFDSCGTKIVPQISVFARNFHIEHRHNQENINFPEYYWRSTEMPYSYWLGNWKEVILQIQ